MTKSGLSWLRVLPVFLSSVLISNNNLAATPQVDANGKLIGATGVRVCGKVYDVQFRDDTFSNIFGDASGLDATSSVEATSFGLALLDQVLKGTFDDNPELTFGCENTNLCAIYIPYELIGSTVNNVATWNRRDGASQDDGFAPIPQQLVVDNNLGDVTQWVYADFQFVGVLGDVNDDFELSVTDLLITGRCVTVYGATSCPLWPQYGRDRADLYPPDSGDGLINVSDLLLLWTKVIRPAIPGPGCQ